MDTLPAATIVVLEDVDALFAKVHRRAPRAHIAPYLSDPCLTPAC